ncbi:unnamed protein product, partial [Acanthoscelides obtectus]
REKICKKCGYKGHVSKQCRTKPGKRRTHYESTTVKKSRYREPDKDDDDHNTNYVFHIDNDCDILCMIGGIPVQMIIGSGSKCNILNDETWTYLKNSQVSVSNQIKRPKKILMAYASKEPLTILGCFDAEIKVSEFVTRTTFYVVQNGTRNLFGKDTAKSLGVLRIGISAQSEVNAISAFPKFKNVVVDIPIDQSIKPVIQPYRRIPIPLETRVLKKIEEMVNSDILNQ